MTKPYDWTAEHARLWDELVPPTGQASTLRGELIRMSGKLSDEAYRNGNINWYDEFERMARFIGQYLDDPHTFSVEERALIRESVEEIIRDHADPDVSGHGSAYYTISEKVVDWCIAHQEPIPYSPDPSLGG